MTLQLQQHPDLCTVTPTEGAFYLLVKIHTQKNDLELVKRLITDFKVAVIPGCAFGLEECCYVRISYGMLDEERADVAIERLVMGIRTLC